MPLRAPTFPEASSYPWLSRHFSANPGRDPATEAVSARQDGRSLSPDLAQPVAGPVGKRPILVVDDDPSVVEIVAEILIEAGYPVETAANGAQALQAIKRVRPALVLLDMQMPVLNGWEFAQRLREDGIRLPIIAMTATRNARRWAEEIDAQGYVSKPFELNELLTAVEQWYDP